MTTENKLSNSSTFKKSFFGAAIGTMIEYYDFALFSTFLPILAPLFFPADTAYQSLIKGYFVLLVTTIMRPLGGLSFGYFGDTFGRRKALLGSMYGIALATIVMGITPSYASIGIWASISVIVAKAVQIFCFGGEYNGAGIYVIEHAKNRSEVLISSLLTATTLFGSLIASLIGILLTFEVMPDWSWRIAFAIGGLIGVFGIFYRKNLAESPHFKAADSNYEGLRAMFNRYPKELVAGFFTGGSVTIMAATLLIFVNPVLMAKGYFTAQQFMVMQSVLTLIAIIVLVLVGKLFAEKSPLKLMQFSCWTLMICSYPLALGIASGKTSLIFLAETGFIISSSIFFAPSNAFLKRIFPMQYRYRASSFSACLGMCVIGGVTPIVESYLYEYSASFVAISAWLFFVGLSTLWAISRVKLKD